MLWMMMSSNFASKSVVNVEATSAIDRYRSLIGAIDTIATRSSPTVSIAVLATPRCRVRAVYTLVRLVPTH
jgi:hypothetical protein